MPRIYRVDIQQYPGENGQPMAKQTRLVRAETAAKATSHCLKVITTKAATAEDTLEHLEVGRKIEDAQ